MVIKSKFGKDLLVWYSSLNFNDGSNKVTKTDFIWYNSHLKIHDRVLYLKCMSENGIKKGTVAIIRQSDSPTNALN